MLKALLHKQMLEVRRMYFYNKRKGTVVTKKSKSVGLIILFAFIYLMMLGTFFALSFLIGGSLLNTEYVWIFLMIMTVLAFLVGLIGSVLSTYAALFKAKDNEFLLAMPIPPSKILLARMVSVYTMSLVYEGMVLIPTIIVYFGWGHPSALGVIFSILGFFILGFLILTFSCLFGWLIALIASKLKNQKILTVIISVLIIVVFMYLRIRANYLFRELALHAQEIGESMKGWGYPIYSLGLGMSGNVAGFLVFTAITAVLFALTCFFMSKSFLKIVSTKNEAVKADFSEKQIRTENVGAALRKKEMRRFTSSPTYMVNCGLGMLFLLAGAVFLLIKANYINELMGNVFGRIPAFTQLLPVMGAFAVCLLTAFCDIAAPSISLEGQHIWVLQTMPVDPYAVFRAKLYVHIILTIIPAVICAVAVGIALKVSVFTFIMIILCVMAFVYFSATAMLSLDLKRPMLDWTNEAQPIKQSVNIVISMFGFMILACILCALYLLVSRFLDPAIYLLICTVILAVLTWLLHRWLKRKGRMIFQTL